MRRVVDAIGCAVLLFAACRNEPPPAATRSSAPAASSPSETAAAATPSDRREASPPSNPVAAEPASAATAAAPTATSPASASAPALRLLPLADAEVGEWCRYRMREEQVQELRVASVDSGVVAIEVKMFRKGKPLGLPATRTERSDEDRIAAHAQRVGAQVAASESSVEAAGMRWPCRLITETWTDEGIHYVRRTWYHDAAPVCGVVKMEQTADGADAASMELTDYGPH